MASELIMPKLSMTMEEGQIVNWLKDEGEEVEAGEVILEVLSDKTNFEIESPDNGILLKKLYQEDDVVPVTEVIAYIGEEDEDIDELIDKTEEDSAAEIEEVEEESSDKAEEKEEVKIESDVEISTESEEIVVDKIKTVPAVRRIARENNIDLNLVKASSEDNVIRVKDIREYMDSKAAKEKEKEAELKSVKEPSSEETIIDKLTGIRKASAKKVKESWTEIPHVTITNEVNMEKLLELKDDWNKHQGDDKLKVSVTDILIKIVATVMEKHKVLNAYLEEEKIVYNDNINIGLAVSLGDKLTAPVLKDLKNQKIQNIVKEKQQLIEKAKNNKLSSEDLSGARLTITNLGMYGTEIFTPIINAPASSILGVGKIKKKPVVVDDEIVIQRMMWLSLAFDHRLVEGAPAANFLNEIKELIEFPAKVMF
ncbi:dihydrolipoamide acetyltransferase family protein [Halanaerobium hydrogeniformans]|uniref:Dihydrolipoamide acetyltransferase component of pyruvate dehydrogenase complex n=1 Tax=Halanaerobium hydrogeniformans TaxID=656519 RepID=E4RKW2_HALHG|nr:dihydrolipoamide acetyltransferase family protein [Halanaerobium hydrogeniformans]ADQ15703.1 catalytic domain-containing protein of components of various dehydrogenase complexes [Halanaerobium hydrogeniformans]